MYRLTAADISHACGASILFGDETVGATTVVIDSREVKKGSLFIAFSGEHVDGHDYLVPAALAGATVLLVTNEAAAFSSQDKIEEAGATVLLVSDAQIALRNLAVFQRSLLEEESVKVVGITGSNGKTTAKEFCAAALASQFSVVSTSGNQNNEIGVPLTILRATEKTQILIVEMGMRAKGEIEDSALIARPHIGLITSTGLSHIEILGSREAIAVAKGELIEGLEPQGCAIVNIDDDFFDFYVSLARDVVISVGEGAGSVVISRVTLDNSARASATISGWFGQVGVRLPVPGQFQVRNAAYAICVCALLGGDVSKAAAALSEVEISGMRYQTIKGSSGITIINDAYNANPVSMEASLRTFAAQTIHGRKYVVIGDMKELGEEAIPSHEKIGALLGELHFHGVYTYGELSKIVAKEATDAGATRVSHYDVGTLDKLSDDILSLAKSGDVVLLKASRSMELERVALRIGEGSVR